MKLALDSGKESFRPRVKIYVDASRKLEFAEVRARRFQPTDNKSMHFGFSRAVYWARIDRIYYGSSKTDAAAIGFDDDHIYREIPLPISERAIPTERILADEAITAFQAWETADDKIEY